MNILRTSLFVLAASSIAFTSCNKKENEILDELEALKTEHNATAYMADADASFSLKGNNITVKSGYNVFNHSFTYKFLNTGDVEENAVYISQKKGTETVDGKTVSYDYYTKEFTTTIYENSVKKSENSSDYDARIIISFKTYSGTLSNSMTSLGLKNDGTPHYITVAYLATKGLEDNDYWFDGRSATGYSEYNQVLKKSVIKEVFTLTNYTYDEASGALKFGITGKFEGSDIDGKDAAVDFSGTISSKIYKEVIMPNMNMNNDNW